MVVLHCDQTILLGDLRSMYIISNAENVKQHTYICYSHQQITCFILRLYVFKHALRYLINNIVQQKQKRQQRLKNIISNEMCRRS